MPTDAERLATIKSNILARLEAMTANPKPSYTIDGETWNWEQYQSMLFRQLEKIDAQIVSTQGPFTHVSVADT